MHKTEGIQIDVMVVEIEIDHVHVIEIEDHIVDLPPPPLVETEIETGTEEEGMTPDHDLDPTNEDLHDMMKEIVEDVMMMTSMIEITAAMVVIVVRKGMPRNH